MHHYTTNKEATLLFIFMCLRYDVGMVLGGLSCMLVIIMYYVFLKSEK